MPAPIPAQAGGATIGGVMTTAANGASFIPITRPGTLLGIYYVHEAAVATANLVLTAAYADPGSSTFNNINNGVGTIATSATAGVATVVPCTPTFVQDGGVVRITRSGGATGGANISVQLLMGP